MKHLIKPAIATALIILCVDSASAQNPNRPPTSTIWDLALKAAGIVVGAVGTFWQLRNVISKPRSTLKADLEVFKILAPGDPNYDIVKEHLSKTIRKIYLPEQEEGFSRFKVYSRSDFIFGMVFMFGFSTWTLYLVKDGFSWWALITGLFAVAGLGSFLKSLDENHARKSSEISK